MSEIFNNNGITLRSEKAAALSFNEMDQNFSSFFYSASAVRVNTTNKLRLFYTGSDTLDNGFEADRYMEVLLPDAAETTTTVGSSINIPGSANQIMFNTLNDSGESILGASGNFVFSGNNKVGIGLNDPNAPLTLKSTDTGMPSSVIIRANNSEDEVTNTRGYYEVNRGGTVLFRLGKTTAGGSGEGVDNTHLFSRYSLELGCTNFSSSPNRKMRINGCGVIIGDDVSPTVSAASHLTVIGELSVGLQKAAAQLGYIGGIGECNLANLLPTNSETTGVLIQSPKGAKGGVVAIGLNTDTSKCESFSVLRGCQGSFDSSIATFRADGKVGIGFTNPKELFHVEGNITGSGNISAAGNLSIDGTATVRTIDAGSAAITSALVTTTAGVVQKIAAAPVPVGGIIMWSGTVSNIPAGWRLCDAETEVNGVRVPNLSNKFVIGGVGDTTIGGEKRVYTDVEGSAKKCFTGGSNTISRTETCKLTECHIPSHNHTKSNGDSYGRCSKFLTSFQVGCHVDKSPFCTMGAFSGMNNSAGISFGGMNGITSGGGTDNSIGDSQCPEMIIRTSYECLACAEIQTYGRTTNYQCSINLGFTIQNVVPEYYALAFIIYVGQ